VDDLGVDSCHPERLPGVCLEPLAVVAARAEDFDLLHVTELLSDQMLAA
jgi:H2-forming N5,N10-methylenetetrahydromethanopterin dehydrogenase-like enzyme